MYDIEAMVSETSPTVLKLSADWPVDWLRGPGVRTMEIQRELLHGKILGLSGVLTQRAEIDGNRANWKKLRVGDQVVVRCFFPGERTQSLGLTIDLQRELKPVNLLRVLKR